MKKVINSTHYVRDPEVSVEYNDGIGEATPDRALTLEELIQRFVQGRDIDIIPAVTVPEEFDAISQEFGVTLQQLSNLTKLEKLEMAEELGKTIQTTRTNLQSLQELANQQQQKAGKTSLNKVDDVPAEKPDAT